MLYYIGTAQNYFPYTELTVFVCNMSKIKFKILMGDLKYTFKNNYIVNEMT